MHQFIDRETSTVVTEKLVADRLINTIYSTVRERSPLLFELLTSARTSELLRYLNYDNPLVAKPSHLRKLVSELNIDLRECLADAAEMNTPRKLFERQIRYWETRPMTSDPLTVVSPADARMLAGSFAAETILQLKEKFFDFEELVGQDKTEWLDAFRNGDYAVFRLTPDKYHYNHVPVSGRVVDFYQIEGHYHSCNPTAVVTLATPYSKNKRTVTVLDTDIEGGSQLGLVMMIELVALMIGEIRQCYSETAYDNPSPVEPGMFLKRGCPKSLYRPGSSVDILIFQPNRVSFCSDILKNLHRRDAVSRYSLRFQQPLVETDIKVRSTVAFGHLEY